MDENTSNENEYKEQNETKDTNETDFPRIIQDFINDISNTFPEYIPIISRWWLNDTPTHEQIDSVLVHCQNVFPERFFDILYKNEEIFSLNSENTINTEFLPGIVFKYLWHTNISEHTKEVVWKYLQLILIYVVSNSPDKDNIQFGDTAKLFEFINEDELKEKLEETFSNINNMFNDVNSSNEEKETDEKQDETYNIPSPEKINEQLDELLGGKLGKLAMELTDDAMKEFQDEFKDDPDMNDENVNSKKIFEKLFKNPSKMMNIIKNASEKLDRKVQSGEINQSELLEESAEFLKKMKNTVGLADLQKMFTKMGGMPSGSKINLNAMESQMNKNAKQAKMRERFKQKLEAKRAQEELDKMIHEHTHQQQPIRVFSAGEKPQKTPRDQGLTDQVLPSSSGKNKNKKSKKTKK